MAETFQCPSCGAPLNLRDTGATMHCPYCNHTVIVPETLRGGSIDSTIESIFPDPERIREILATAQDGNKIGAIKQYREITGAGLKEAKEAVEAMLEGRPVEITKITVTSTEMGEGLTKLIRNGDKIGAIKQYREMTDAGLKEAKEAIEAMFEGRPVEISTKKAVKSEIGADIVELVDSGNKIEAIKRLREQTGLGLKEAKDAIDAIQAAQTWGNTMADLGMNERQLADLGMSTHRPTSTSNSPSPVIQESQNPLMKNCIVIMSVLGLLVGCLIPLLIWFFVFSPSM